MGKAAALTLSREILLKILGLPKPGGAVDQC